MKAFITGITGFAGPYLAEHLLDSGDEVLGSSLNGCWSAEIGERLRSNVRLFAWDITQVCPAALQQLVADFRPDVIYHLAAMSVPGDCGATEPTVQAQAVNVEGTRTVLELAERLTHRPRFFFASSAHVYAPVNASNPFVDERATIDPTTGYGKTKLAAEAILAELGARHGLETVIARVFKHAGPRQSTRLMLAQWAQQLVQPSSNPIQVYSLNSFFDLSDVRDMTRGFRLLAERGRAGETLNIGAGVNYRSGEVLALMQRLAGNQSPIIETRPEIRQEPIPVIAKIFEQTGWRPQISLEQTLRDTLAYWRNLGN